MRIVVTGATGNVGTSLSAARRRSGVDVGRRGRPSTADMAAAEGRVGRSRRRGRRARPHRRRCRCRRPPVVADPAVAGPACDVGDERRRYTAYRRRGRPSRDAGRSSRRAPSARTPRPPQGRWSTSLGRPTGRPSRHIRGRRRWRSAPSTSSPRARPTAGWCGSAPALIFKRDSARHVRNLFVGNLVPLGCCRSRGGRGRAATPAPVPGRPRRRRRHGDPALPAVEVRGAFNLAAPGVLGHATRPAPPLVARSEANGRGGVASPARARRPRLADARRVCAADVHRASHHGARLGPHA